MNVDNIISYIKEHNLVLATAESCTAGKIMSTLADHGDCGDCLFIGYVVYNSNAKKKQLGVKEDTINQYTLTSEEVAKEMASGAFQFDEINVAIATTGITGDKSMDGISPGTVCIAWAFKDSNGITIFSETQLYHGSPEEISQQTVNYALEQLKKYHQINKNHAFASLNIPS